MNVGGVALGAPLEHSPVMSLKQISFTGLLLVNGVKLFYMSTQKLLVLENLHIHLVVESDLLTTELTV